MARKDRGSAGAWFPRWFWPSFATPAIVWLLLFFVLPFYVILSVAFGGLDQIFLTATPVYNPLHWTFGPFREVVSGLVTTDTIYQETFVRTLVYVGIATALCLLIGYPVAYFIARHAGRAKTFFLVAFIAPFWISYMMRMFSWVNLLQPEGYVNRILQAVGVINEPVPWLNGKPSTVILGLVYGYFPLMVLPIYAALGDLDPSLIEAGKDLYGTPRQTFWHVTWPASLPGVLGGVILTFFPALGDFATAQFLGGPDQAMIGNLINQQFTNSGLIPFGAALTMVLIGLVLIGVVIGIVLTRGRLRQAARGLAAVDG